MIKFIKRFLKERRDRKEVDEVAKFISREENNRSANNALGYLLDIPHSLQPEKDREFISNLYVDILNDTTPNKKE